MRPESRTLIVIAVLGIGSVVALGTMATRYQHVLTERQGSRAGATATVASAGAGEQVPQSSADGRAREQVDSFLAVRRAVAVAAVTLGQPAAQNDPRASQLIMIRDRALSRTGLDAGNYVKLRRLYRLRRGGGRLPPGEIRAAFDEAWDDLEAVDLGAWEAFDR